tara:strand:+ start:1243 stop:1512 length:270 start_codon:yes stop_codon:yes gene_type:complete
MKPRPSGSRSEGFEISPRGSPLLTKVSERSSLIGSAGERILLDARAEEFATLKHVREHLFDLEILDTAVFAAVEDIGKFSHTLVCAQVS